VNCERRISGADKLGDCRAAGKMGAKRAFVSLLKTGTKTETFGTIARAVGQLSPPYSMR
jgi:hypothetical protein